MSVTKFLTPPIMALLVGCTDRHAPFFMPQPKDTNKEMDTPIKNHGLLQTVSFEEVKKSDVLRKYPFLQEYVESIEKQRLEMPRGYIIANMEVDIFIGEVKIKNGTLLFANAGDGVFGEMAGGFIDVYLNQDGDFRNVLHTVTYKSIRVADISPLTLFLTAPNGDRTSWILNKASNQFEIASSFPHKAS